VSHQLTMPPRLRPALVDVHGTPVAVRRRGAGPALLYLHGAGMAGHWLRFHETLAEVADVIAPDQIGCGGTPMQDWLRGFDDLVVHLDDLRSALGIAVPFDLVGYSFGGWVAAEFAVVYPHLVRSLVLVAPIGLGVTGGPALRVDPFAATPQELAAVTFNDFAGMARSSGATAELYRERTVYGRLMWQRPYSRRLPRLLRRVTCPALVIAAGDDRYVPPSVARRYHELLPGSRLRTIDGAGHALVVERPDAVAAEIAAFLGDGR
jgi:pimeloyl-ACP methyl ester carboxylesterase